MKAFPDWNVRTMIRSWDGLLTFASTVELLPKEQLLSLLAEIREMSRREDPPVDRFLAQAGNFVRELIEAEPDVPAGEGPPETDDETDRTRETT